MISDEKQLSVFANITARASGSVKVSYQAAGRTTHFTSKVDSANRRVKFDRSLSSTQARPGTGILTLDYPGDPDTQPQSVRLRAATQHADLTATRPVITSAGRLTASGTLSKKARGVVRLQLLFEPPGMRTRTLLFQARIANGRYRFNVALGAANLAAIAHRRGVVHSYILFTGYLTEQMRGEQLSYQVLGQP